MRKWCGPARPGLTGHTGKITPSYSDGLFSTYQATIFPIPPTTCHNLLFLWSQERRTRSVKGRAEMTRRGAGPAHPSGKDTPAKGCVLLTTGWLTSAFQSPKKHIWCLCHPLGAAQGGDLLGTQGVSADQSQDPGVAKVLGPPFHIEGLSKWARTCSALVQEITCSAFSCLLRRRALIWVPRSKGFLCKDQQPHSGWIKQDASAPSYSPGSFK